MSTTSTPDAAGTLDARRGIYRGVALERLRAVRAAEEERYVRAHPKSEARTLGDASGYYAGVPMHWMLDWPLPFPLVVASARGATLTDVDGHSLADFCLGDTGSMFGHSPEPVVRALTAQAGRGLAYMLPTEDGIADDTDHNGEQSAREVLAFANDDDVDVGPAIRAARERVHVARAATPDVGVRRRQHNMSWVRPVVAQAFPDSVRAFGDIGFGGALMVHDELVVGAVGEQLCSARPEVGEPVDELFWC